MMFAEPPSWDSQSSDPNDDTFADVVEVTSLEAAAEYDVVLVGEPYDEAVIGRQGAAAGPAAIRASLAGLKTHHLEAGPVAVADDAPGGTERCRVGDLGTVSTLESPPSGVAGTQRGLEAATKAVYESGARPVFLGGDNSLSVPNVAPLLGGSASVGVVSLDAHLDCRKLHDGPTSGTPYRQLHARGLDTIAVVGARNFETSTRYVEYLEDQGGTIVPADAVRQDRAAALASVRDAMADVERVYLSLDVDVLEAAAAPGVSAPTPGGLTTGDAFALLEALARDERVVGFEVVECAPPLDRDGRTVDAAARAVAHVLAGWSP